MLRTPRDANAPCGARLQACESALHPGHRMSRLSISLVLVAFLALPAVSRADGKYALVVGVEKYIPTELPSLDYAEDDAQALGGALERLGFSVIAMTCVSDNPATVPRRPRGSSSSDVLPDS